ncbi:GNAT family N-acetyltransferase, partial [Virgibacillus sp. 7505]|uniref:GNAT family N-acetyltransferase n=1 Tax=Virgibacillus sp. 7505 TaxID=2022548 RepID=UPI000BCE5B43
MPEVNDLVVFPPYRRRGVGQALIHALEQLSRDLGYQTVGLGVGLYKDYGSAQRLYARLGYIPDGHGICAGGEPIDAG